MEKMGRYLVNIIKSVINSEKLEFLENHELDYDLLIKLARFHGVEALLYLGIINNNLKIPDNLLKYLHKLYLVDIYRDTTQKMEIEKISDVLEANKIKHMFLKGSVLKKIYPESYYRSMVDADILVSKTEIKQIIPLMKSFDYKVENLGGNHDVYFKEPFMNIEMHREMIDESYELSRYYKNIWGKLKKSSNRDYEYILSYEDFYIYMLAHTAKHFSKGGTGIRSVLDIWVYLKANNEVLDWEYIDFEFQKLNLLKFSKNIKELAFVWFANQETSTLFQGISEFIIASGSKGTTINSRIVEGFIREDTNNLGSRKIKFFLVSAFPPYRKMKLIYPYLRKLPFLLPLMWIVRLLKMLIFKRKVVRNVYRDVVDIDQEDIEKIKKVHEESGI